MNCVCACCGSKNATNNCIKDYLNVGTIVLFTTSCCGCKFNAPVCPKCYSMYNGKSFICKHCNQKSYFNVYKKKLFDCDMDISMSAVLLGYRIAISKKSQSSSFLIWSDLCEFYLQIQTKCDIFPAMFRIWLQTRAPKPRQNIFSVNNLMVTYHDFRKCKRISLEHVLAFFRYFAFRIVCSKKMFYMSHRLDPKMYSINLRVDRKFSSMIDRRVLSKLTRAKLNYIRSLE